jgi:glycosyltransferase involved in cell wall biosynthesis
MRIGFDISQTGANKAGCGYFAHAMIQAILELAPQNSYSLFPTFGDFYFDGSMSDRNPYSGDDVQYGAWYSSYSQAQDFWTGPEANILLDQLDIVHANNFWCPPQQTSGRVVYTFYDMSFAIDPSWTTEANRVGCFAGVFQSAVMADWIVAISEASRAHYLSIFPHFPEHRIRVIYPSSRFADATVEGKRPKAFECIAAGTYWLSVGTIEPRKNQRRLVDAYARYRALGGTPMPLVLAGGKGWLMDDFQQHLNEQEIATDVIMLGYVSDEELIWLYRNCYANIYPSLFEGFGLPVLEGMQFGAPTLTSRCTSIPEVTGDAAILIAPEDTEGWVQAMLRLAASRDERDRLSMAARERAAKFDWKRNAASLLRLYDEILAAPKRQFTDIAV